MKRIPRGKAIEALRQRLGEMVDDATAACEVAGRHGILCGGFKQWSFSELKQRFYWIAERQPDVTRAELERLASAWLLAQEEVHGLPLACDVQQLKHDTCRGWDEFTNGQLSDFLVQLGEEDARVFDE